jgi:exodeoxyribonuclease VIII
MLDPLATHPIHGAYRRQEPDADYRAAHGLNWSRLKVLDKSPLHYKHAIDHPRADTPALSLGRAFHAALLEPDRYAAEFRVWPGSRAGRVWEAVQANLSADRVVFFADVAARRGKAWTEAKDAAPDGAVILVGAEQREYLEIVSDLPSNVVWLTQGEADTVAAMVKGARSNPRVLSLLSADGMAEVSLYWTEGEGQYARRMKARADLVITYADRVLLVDLKSSRDVDPRSFGAAAARFGYHGQLAHYAHGLEQVYRLPVECIIIAVESSAPHDSAVYHLDDLAMEAGRQMRDRLLAELAECEAAQEWPGQVPHAATLQLPMWAMPDIDGAAFTYPEEN